MSDDPESDADAMTPPEWAKSVDERLTAIESTVNDLAEKADAAAEAADDDADEDAEKAADDGGELGEIAETLERLESKVDEHAERVDELDEELDAMKDATGVAGSQQIDAGATSEDAEKSAWSGVFTGRGGD